MDSLEKAWNSYSSDNSNENTDLLVKEIENYSKRILSTYGIHPYHSDYEDLVQTGFVEFFSCIGKFDNDIGNLKSFFKSRFRGKIFEFFRDVVIHSSLHNAPMNEAYSSILEKDSIPSNYAEYKKLDNMITEILTEGEAFIYNNFLKKGLSSVEDIPMYTEEEIMFYLKSIRDKTMSIIREKEKYEI